jgi:hypothetical protein
MSPTGEVMNDGIGRMSWGLGKMVSSRLGLPLAPCGYQARIGSAKGFWIVDSDVGDDDDIWIETYPSQRKWTCDYLDEDHRTFEVKSPVHGLRAAALNQQFIPVLEERALDHQRLRRVISNLIVKTLQEELDRQRMAMEDPAQYRIWIHTHSAFRGDRISKGRVDFLGGLPRNEEERINFLLDGGFHPRSQRYLHDLVWKTTCQQFDKLKAKLNIRVPRSTFAYMVVDFLGVLEEGEVHLGFSSKFECEGTAQTLLHGIDVLVARAPAHFVSDIQKVRAVFRPELHFLKDVIVFPTKGGTALAEVLSGGDYDGDQAWVCWDSEIVSNFQNAPVPSQPDLFRSGHLRKETGKFEDLLTARNDLGEAVTDFIHEGLSFNMQQQLLGICTSYKSKLCYQSNSVSDESAILLSTLVGHLVDQGKQGIVFTGADWERLRKERNWSHLPDPAYTKDQIVGSLPVSHILDYLKFGVAIPTIENALKDFNAEIIRKGTPQYFDADLTYYSNRLDGIAKRSRTWTRVRQALQQAIHAAEKDWKKAMSIADAEQYAFEVQAAYEKWLAIKPTDGLHATVAECLQADLPDSQSLWGLLKASTTFKLCYRLSPTFSWQMAGRQLQRMKAMRQAAQHDDALVTVTPRMYAILRPDKGIVAGLLAKDEAASYAESVADGPSSYLDNWGFVVDDA